MGFTLALLCVLGVGAAVYFGAAALGFAYAGAGVAVVCIANNSDQQVNDLKNQKNSLLPKLIEKLKADARLFSD